MRPGIDLGRDIKENLKIEAIEDLGRIFRLHVLVHGDEPLEAGGFDLVLLLHGGIICS